MRERTGVAGRSAMLVEKGYRAATLSDRRCPVLSVVVGGMWPRCGPKARGGHGRRGRTALQCGGDGHKLNRRVSPYRMTTCLVGKPLGRRGSGGASVAAERPPRPPDGGRRALDQPDGLLAGSAHRGWRGGPRLISHLGSMRACWLPPSRRTRQYQDSHADTLGGVDRLTMSLWPRRHPDFVWR
jgi:hypothetical protein